MTLNKEDFTDEQWAAIQSDIDRRITQASETARKNAAKALEQDVEDRIKAALDEERARLEMDEQQKLEVERKKIEDARRALDVDRKTLAATKKLVAAGFAEDKVDSLIPMFVNVEDKSLDGTLESFIQTYQDGIKTQVDAAKQELLKNASAPNTSSDAPVDNKTAALEAAKAGNDAQAIELLLGATAAT